MPQITKSRPVLFVSLFFLVCLLFRGIEYFVIRTDQTFFGEAFIHKLVGIALLAAVLQLLHYSWGDIGFRSKLAAKGMLWGLLLGGSVYAVAYGVEFLIQAVSANSPDLQFYVTSYAIQGNRGMQDGLLFVLLCVIGNVINVVMEEGVFRGLFPRLMVEKYSFAKACLFSSILFGIWHIVQPVRNVMDGEQSVMGALMSAILLVSTSTLLAIQFCMLLKITGSLWAGMAVHFINNVSVNLLHISTVTGIDEMQTMRITIAQTLSFVIVLVFFIRYMRHKKFEKQAAIVS